MKHVEGELLKYFLFFKEEDKNLAEKLQQFIQKLDDLKNFKLGQFEIILDDPSGDSFIENPLEPKKDPNMTVAFYKRTKEQNEMVGINVAAKVLLHYLKRLILMQAILQEDTSQEEQLEDDLKNEVILISRYDKKYAADT